MARDWFKTLAANLGAVAALGAAGTASALTLGPALDFHQVVSTSDPGQLYATAWAPPFPGVQQPALRGQVQITLQAGAGPLPVIGIGYLSSVSGRFDQGSLRFTSIFGMSRIAPSRPYPDDEWVPVPLHCCGTSGGMEQPIIIFGGYGLIGATGTAYVAPAATPLTLSELPSVLVSGVDLSPFAGDPAGVFYVYQIDFPAAELLTALPEPGSALLLAAGLALLASSARRMRAVSLSAARGPAAV